MKWQDVVIALAYVVFNLALFPSITSKNKPALSTSLLTGICNFAISIVQTTLGLYLAAFATFVNATLWIILAYQKKVSK